MNCRLLPALLCLVLAGGVVGCTQGPPQIAPAQPPVVPISKPVQRLVTDFVDFTGRTDAVQSVGIRARVTGYLVKIPFKEGSEVKEGELLFEIDPRPYEAQADQAKAQVALNEAQLTLAVATYDRDAAVLSSGAVTRQQLDQDRAAVDEAKARIKAAKASLEVYNLNLGFTKVTSPITGQVSRYYLTLGNLVMQDQTLLTTVVSLDPMYAYFDMDESTLLRIRQAINEGKIQRAQDWQRLPPALGASTIGLLQSALGQGPLLASAALIPGRLEQVPVYMGLQVEGGYPHRGNLNFVNNQVNPSTGSISVRGQFPNPVGPGGSRLLSPGMFVRIHLPIGRPHPALLVIDRAISSDQGLKYVYVIDADNKVQYRKVRIGALQDDGLRVVEGLNADDWVVVGALQQIRPSMPVQTERVDMPTIGAEMAPADLSRPIPPPAGASGAH